jgi:hypothetical protein
MPEPTPVDPKLLAAGPTADIPRLYVNAVAIRGGAFDVTLDLGYSIPADSPGQAPHAPEWLARVSMSWEHANAFKRFLENAIKQYETQAGELPDVEKLRAQAEP